MRLVTEGKAVPVCPEVLGGLSIPRPACEQQADGRITTQDGKDMTSAFAAGARQAVAVAKQCHCTTAILKSRSPSCGHGEVYDGTFSHKVISGNGVFAQALLDAGIHVMRDEDLPEAM